MKELTISFLTEIVISAYLVNHVNLVCVQTYNHH